MTGTSVWSIDSDINS